MTGGRASAGLLYAGFLLVFFAGLDLAVGRLAPASVDRSFRVAHPYYHHGLRPDASAETSWGGRPYAMRTNSLGFRDDAAVAIDPTPHGRRVVLLGDSMIEGLGVAYADTVAGILAARGRPHDVEVLNAGVVSYSPKLYDLKTRWLVEREGLRFDALVVFVDISDVQDEVRYEAFVPQPEAGAMARVRSWWRRHSLVAQLADRFFAAERPIDNRFRRDAQIDVWLATLPTSGATSNSDAGRWEWTYDDALFDAWGRKGLELAATHMAELAAFCREHQIALTIAVYPGPFQIFANEREGRQNRFWREFCAREQIGFIDLFPAFIDPATYPGPDVVYERFFIPDDVHWNEAGHALVADRIEAAVLGSAR